MRLRRGFLFYMRKRRAVIVYTRRTVLVGWTGIFDSINSMQSSGVPNGRVIIVIVVDGNYLHISDTSNVNRDVIDNRRRIIHAADVQWAVGMQIEIVQQRFFVHFVFIDV